MWCGSGRSRSRQRLKSDDESSSYNEEYKIVVVGVESVGKTSLCQCFVHDEDEHRQYSQKSTKGRRTEFNTWETVDGDTCYVRFIELRMTAHDEDDDEIVRCITQGADGFILVYSISDKRTFDSAIIINNILQKIRGHVETPFVLVGNKADCISGRQVATSTGRDAAFDLGSAFYETSSNVISHHTDNIFHDVIRQVRCVRTRSRCPEQTCNRVRGFIHRLSFKSKRKRSQSPVTG